MRKMSELAIAAALALVSRAALVSAQAVNFDDPSSVQSVIDGLTGDKAPVQNLHPQPGHGNNDHGHNGHGQPNHPNHHGHPNQPGHPIHPGNPTYPGFPNHPGQPQGPWTPGYHDHDNHWHHNPWHVHPQPGHPAPYPGQYSRTITFESGDFSFYSDARSSMDSAVKELQAGGMTVMESRLNGARYTLVFMAPNRARLEKFASGEYSYYSDAREGMARAAAALKADGKLPIEVRLNGSRFTISYMDGLHYDGGWQTQRFAFASGSFSYYSDARSSMQQAVEGLRETGCVLYESRLNGASYILVFDGPARSRIQEYASGQYSFYSDAREGMARAARMLESQGNVLLETRLNGAAFTISYLSSYHPYH